MRKYVSIILMCMFLSVPISAQEYVSNGIKQSQAVAVLPKPKLAIYVDNRLYNDTLIGAAMISKEGNLMIPSSAHVVKDRFTSRAIEFSNGYQISIDRKTLTTPQGQRKVTTETAVYNGTTYYSYSFLTKDLGVKATKQVIEGIPCYFFWKDLSPSTEPKPDLLPVSQYMEYIPSFIIGEGGEIVRPDEKHIISTRQLGSNIYNTTTCPKGSTFEQDLAYLRSLNYDGKGYRSMYGVSEMNTYISYLIGNSDIKLVAVQNFKPYSQTLQFNEREWVIESHNQLIEALKYYSQDPNDAMLIFNYVNTCYKNNVTIPTNTFMTFGKTKVFFRRDSVNVTDFTILLHPDNWENAPYIEWNRGVSFDYTYPLEGDYIIYKPLNPKNVLASDQIVGSNTYLTKVRNAKSTLKQDIAYLNTLMTTGYENTLYPYVALCGCNFEVHKHLLDGKKEVSPYDSQGYMNVWTFEAMKTSDRIEVTSGNGRKFTMSSFWYRNQTSLSDDSNMRMTYRQNMIIETIKYLSKDVEDGKRIYLYLNDCIINKQQPTLKTVMTFGKTKVKFAKGAQGQGYSIEFLP